METINFIAALFPVQPNALGLSELFYLLIVCAVVLSSFAFLLKPFVNLAVTIFYLASANTAILGPTLSAAIAALLIANCLAGTVLVSGLKIPIERTSLRAALLLCAIAAFGAVNGYVHGNRALLVLGDFYQIIEFALLFVLAQVLVRTEQQFRTMVIVLIGSIAATSVLQIADVLTDASYLSLFHLERQEGPDLLRTINMNAPIAFILLLVALPSAETKKWLLAGLVLVEVNLIWSFTRGLWVATLASAFFLLIMMRNSRVAILKFGFAAGIFAVAFLYAFDLEDVVGGRISYGAKQLRSAPLEEQKPKVPPQGTQVPGARPQGTQVPGLPPQEKQTLSGRRRLEFILTLPHVAEHPIVGEGLGATFEIAGDAVLGAPKGEQFDLHYIHNLYLQVAFRLGIPALLVFLVLLWEYFRRTIKNLRTLDLSPDNTALMGGLTAAMFGEVVLSLTSPIFLNHPTAGVTGCIMAMTMTALHQSAQRPARIDTEYPPDKASS